MEDIEVKMFAKFMRDVRDRYLRVAPSTVAVSVSASHAMTCYDGDELYSSEHRECPRFTVRST